MKSIVTILTIATALASLTMSVPMDIFKRQQLVFNSAVVVMCAPAGDLPDNCKAALAIPGLVPSIDLHEITFDFTGLEPWSPLVSSSNLVGNMISLGIPNPVSTLSIHVDVLDGNVKVGRLETPANPATASGTAVSTSFEPVPMPIPADAHDAFSTLLATVVSTESKNITFHGTLDATFDLPFPLGKKTIPGLGFDVTMAVKGFNGLRDVTFVSLVSNVRDDVHNRQTITFKMDMKSPSTYGLKMGDVVFDTAGPAGPIGTTTLKDLVLQRGDNVVTVIAVIDLNLPGAAGFISGLGSADATMTLTGSGSSPANPVILSAIQALKINITIPEKYMSKTV
ncbi:hypothetical protein BG003_001372 [Podila horticola]|nr:hypothetical protein BG003_001372 [Podila horticola]